MTLEQPEALRLADWLERRTNVMLQDGQAAAELRRLVAEVEALRADAERYRWLRDNKFKHNGHCLALIGPILWEETLDAAIDAAKEKT